MSTGNIVVGPFPSYTFRKTWSGGDGRSTWNSYHMDTLFNSQVPNYNGYMGTLYVPSEYVATFPANKEIDLINKLAESIKGHQFNLGVALGQRAETVEMVTSTVGKLVTCIRSIKRGRFDLAVRALGGSSAGHKKLHPGRKMRSDPKNLTSNDVSAAWLELQYGWLPLLGDVHEAALAYEAMTKKPREFTQRVSASVSIAQDFVRLATPSLGNGYATGHSTSKIDKNVIVKFSEAPSSARSLGLHDPLSIAWELIPFSFVADWFIPIGPYLEAVHTIPNLTNASFLVSVKREDLLKYDGNGYPTYYAGCTGITRYVVFDRSITSSYSVPKPTFKVLEKALSEGHMKNAVALLHQLVQ